jgi:hypothetical protein
MKSLQFQAKPASVHHGKFTRSGGRLPIFRRIGGKFGMTIFCKLAP